MKVHDLAKELGTSDKELIKFLDDVDIKVKSPNTKLEDSLLAEIRTLFQGETPEDKAKEIKIIEHDSATITVQELAQKGNIQLGELMGAILKKGLLLNLNSEIDITTAQDIIEGFNLQIDSPEGVASDDSVRESIAQIRKDEADEDGVELIERPPVITIMGHVDHGKTLLLDTIRKSNVADKEAGGITQHIGAYQVDVKDKKLTFLDTPGHEAFTTLRARGAQVTDIVIIVVAADEGLKPQTVEAIDHAKAADVPIIVAINKIDKPEANLDQVKQQLSQHELVAEDWGGSTVMLPVSAKTGEGVDALLEMLLLVSEMQELKASANRLARAVVIESKLTKQKGVLATVLVKTGTLNITDHFLIGTSYGKIRAMHDDQGRAIKTAIPGQPVEILGLTTVPGPGCILEVFKTEKDAKSAIPDREAESAAAYKNVNPVSLETLAQTASEGGAKTLNLIVKADVNGSAEAISALMSQIEAEDVQIQIIHSSTGQVNENDIMLAVASSAVVIAFNVDVGSEAARLADEEDVDVKAYSIIYEIADDVKKAVHGMFEPEFEDVDTGQSEVRQLFSFSKVGVIAGCQVLSGTMFRNGQARVLRDGKEVFLGSFDSLKRFKDDVKEVATGFECGIVLDGFNEFQEGDLIVCFKRQEKHRAF